MLVRGNPQPGRRGSYPNPAGIRHIPPVMRWIADTLAKRWPGLPSAIPPPKNEVSPRKGFPPAAGDHLSFVQYRKLGYNSEMVRQIAFLVDVADHSQGLRGQIPAQRDVVNGSPALETQSRCGNRQVRPQGGLQCFTKMKRRGAALPDLLVEIPTTTRRSLGARFSNLERPPRYSS